MVSLGQLDHEGITRAMAARGSVLGQPLTVLSEVESTNDEAKRAARAGAPHGALFVADSQRAGRGRGGKHWHSPAGENLYLSFLIRPAIEPSRMPMISLVTGVAVARVLDEAFRSIEKEPPRVQIKWPNDVYANDAKIAGVLVEAVTRGAEVPDIIVGIGMNVATRVFPQEVDQAATSLALLGAESLDREEWVAAVAHHLGERLTDFVEQGPESTLRELERRDWLAGRTVQVGDMMGVAVGIDEYGQLEVRDDMGAVHAVVSDEVIVPGRSRAERHEVGS